MSHKSTIFELCDTGHVVVLGYSDDRCLVTWDKDVTLQKWIETGAPGHFIAGERCRLAAKPLSLQSATEKARGWYEENLVC